jgi:hypothetical protein
MIFFWSDFIWGFLKQIPPRFSEPIHPCLSFYRLTSNFLS